VIPDFSSTMVLKAQGLQNLLFLIIQRTYYFDFFKILPTKAPYKVDYS
jgi:hypothetical protein